MGFPKLLGTIFSLIGGGTGPLIYYGKSFIKPLKNRTVNWTFGWEENAGSDEYNNKYRYQDIDLTTVCDGDLKRLKPIYKLAFASRENQTNGHIKNKTDEAKGVVGLIKLKVESGGYSPKWKSGKAMFGEKLNGVKLIIVQNNESMHWVAAVETSQWKNQAESIDESLDTVDWNNIANKLEKRSSRRKITKLEIEREVSQKLKTKNWGECGSEEAKNAKNVYESLGNLTIDSTKYKVLDVVSFGEDKWKKSDGTGRGQVWYKNKWTLEKDETEVLIVDMNKAVITQEGIGDNSGIDLKWGPVLKATIAAELKK